MSISIRCSWLKLYRAKGWKRQQIQVKSRAFEPWALNLARGKPQSSFPNWDCQWFSAGWFSYCTPPKWWQCCYLWSEFLWSMHHPGPWRNLIYPGVCWQVFTPCFCKSDGHVVACGQNDVGQCNIPALEEGMSYTQVSAGERHTVLLQSDGRAVACGLNSDLQCNIPMLGEGLSYTQVSAGGAHTVLLRSDGNAVACGNNEHEQCNIPLLNEGMSYTQVSAGQNHTVFLQSDGHAVACGLNFDSQCNIPLLDEGLSYTQVSAGGGHTVLLRSDGNAVACGKDMFRRCSIPPLDEISYVQVFCRHHSHCASPKWWPRLGVRKQSWTTVQHSTVRTRQSVHQWHNADWQRHRRATSCCLWSWYIHFDMFQFGRPGITMLPCGWL